MNLIVEPFRPYHLELLVAQGVQPEQTQQVSHVPAGYANVEKPPGPAVTLFGGGRIILCGGILTMNPKLGVLWAVVSPLAGQHMLWIHRATLRFIDATPLRRLEATVEKGFDAGCRWLGLLGFDYEGDMRAYGEDGETHCRYGLVR